ncbi:MAG: hypothetical protein KME15_01585 [Drouetiella hepatica Uher 2000/2452]|jgi:hypothetical protein|uniref:Uncharacterized protein n=1 Tax=Drouetiella hepatica Uher 2000/2452 TaxID=904376 RepID=A0A951Q8W1_9CYAN|nr:hypothetical protein [Drouetiella hepatica Uher 2000/2452]
MNHYRPWIVIAQFPGHKPKAITRTANRSEAEDLVRFLTRRVPQGYFYVIFEPPEE